MKTKADPRHLRRVKLIKALYAETFYPEQQPDLNAEELAIFKDIVAHRPQINSYIDQYAVKFTTEKMAKLDLAILELGVYELAINNQAPYRVILDEAIELAKEYGASKAANFVNGVLGKLVENLKHDAVNN